MFLLLLIIKDFYRLRFTGWKAAEMGMDAINNGGTKL